MIDQNTLRVRIRRLEVLSRGFGIEEETFRTCSCAIMADEREKYREALRKAIDGVETARLVLVMACQRIDKELRALIARLPIASFWPLPLALPAPSPARFCIAIR